MARPGEQTRFKKSGVVEVGDSYPSDDGFASMQSDARRRQTRVLTVAPEMPTLRASAGNSAAEYCAMTSPVTGFTSST